MQISCRMRVCFAHGQANGVIFLVPRKYTLSSLPSITFCCLSMLYFVADYISYSRVLLNICNGRSWVRLPVKTRVFSSPHRAYRPWCPPRLLDNAYRDISTEFDVYIHGYPWLDSRSGPRPPLRSSSITAFLKLWSADHKWSSGSALVVLLD